MQKLFEDWRTFVNEENKTEEIFEKFKVYLVGGAVRDQLLRRTNHDLDYVVVGATAKDMEEAGFNQVGADFPVFLHPETGDEYALARSERKSGKGHKGFDVSIAGVDLEQDLERRDLTINAIARQVLPGGAYGDVVDPHGGQQDINRKLLRHVSDAFREDPLRVLRVARFASQLDFGVDETTQELIDQMAKEGQLNELTPERIWKELEKTLKSDYPHRFFDVLEETAALEVLFPEFFKYKGVPQPFQYHGGADVWLHVQNVLKKAKTLTDDPAVLWACLCHDLGKTLTDPAEYPKHLGHEKEGVEPVRALCDRLKVPTEYKELALLVTEHHMGAHRSLEMKGSKVVKFLNKLDAFRREGRFHKFLLAVKADGTAKPGKEYPEYEWLKMALNYANQVDARAFVEKGLAGKQIGEAVHQARCSLVKKARRKFKEETGL